ncbi:MAG TPA: hypothetical protein VH414_03995 [Lichenihabitans sp.]|nr:hypothetical protein [Lichenihabitans sp.]
MPEDCSYDLERAALLQSLRDAEEEARRSAPVSREDIDRMISESIALGLKDREKGTPVAQNAD